MKKLMVTAVVVLVLTSWPVLAHHGWGGNEDKISEVTGVVTTGVSLSGPHATMKIKDADGHIWDVTMAPPARTQNAGLAANTIPVGSTVMIHGHRSKDPKKFEMKVTKVTYNGKLFNVYPDMA